MNQLVDYTSKIINDENERIDKIIRDTLVKYNVNVENKTNEELYLACQDIITKDNENTIQPIMEYLAPSDHNTMDVLSQLLHQIQ